MNFDEYRQHDAVGLGKLVQEREVTAAELLELATARAQARNDVVNALVHPMFDTARASVRDAETALPAPLGGVPFLIKDLTAVAGEPCTSGSRLNADVVSPHDATIVTRYRDAGLTIFGKTTTPEFGLNVATETVLCGATRNPWDLTRVPGGSSGGAAAAVADGWLPAANASDGGGSIRIPASCCGLVGLKPSRGRCPSGPDVGEGWGGMSTAHVVCRSVRDSAAFLDATHGPAAGDPYCAPAFDGSFQSGLGAPLPRLRIAVEDKPLTAGVVHADCLAALQSAATLCRDLGHTVDAASPQFDRATYGAATGCIVASNVAATVKSRALALGIDAADAPIEKQTMAMAKFGATIDAATYVQSINTIHRTGRTLASFHDDWDIMLTPVLLAPPVKIGHLSYDLEDSELFGQRFANFWGFTNLQNATGQPAISLPLFWNADGLPVGVQFVGPVGSELRLLQLAAELEQACPWFDRIPPDTTINRSTAALDQKQPRGTSQ